MIRKKLNNSFIAITSCLLLATTAAHAGPREQAQRLHDRIAGVPPQADVLDQMEDLVSAGNASEAAMLAMDNSAFYSVTLKNLVTPWTNEEETVFAPLNDYTATVIGVVRDELDFRRIMHDDLLYVGDSSLGITPYSVSNNNHYEALEDQGIDLKQSLVQTSQSAVTGLPPEATSGVITSRASAKAFFIDGTNRAMFRFTLMSQMCTDLEQIKDGTRSADRIRQDVSRSPGGDSRIYMNACIGCHAGMDPLVQAYAYYNYEYTDNSGQLVYTPGTVQPKYLINAGNFEHGYATPDDRWDNYWRSGPNANLGWDSTLPGSGNGAKSLGREMANSEAFASCQVKKVFKTVCFRDPVDQTDRDAVATITNSFKNNNYNLKTVFADAAVHCMGD